MRAGACGVTRPLVILAVWTYVITAPHMPDRSDVIRVDESNGTESLCLSSTRPSHVPRPRDLSFYDLAKDQLSQNVVVTFGSF